MATTTHGTCRDCGEETEYAYGGSRGFICKPCYIAAGTRNLQRRVEKRKRLCPRCGEHLYDPKRGTMCAHCAPKEYVRVKTRGQPTFHKPSGYWLVKVPDDDPMISMANSQNYVRQHRLVMADHIGRPLTPDENVHHENHDRGDNRIENLTLMGRIDHNRLHMRDRIEAKGHTYHEPTLMDDDEIRRLHVVPGMRTTEMAEIMGARPAEVRRRVAALGLPPFPRGIPTDAELAQRTADMPRHPRQQV